jgi:hypothetical protein
MSDDQRVYSDDEFARILRTAAELASRVEKPGISSNGLTSTEMKSAAAQAGLDPALVERAARLLVIRATASPLERLIGGPLRHEHDARFSIKLDEHNAGDLLPALAASSRSRATSGHPRRGGLDVVMNIPEADWKLLRKLHETALQRYCSQVLDEYRDVLDRPSDSPHARFLELFELTHTRNRDLAFAFDDLRRSTALLRLIAMRKLGVITEEDLLPFSAETRARLESLGTL